MKGHIWINSDLQLAQPSSARAVLQHAVEDVKSLDLKLEAVWCLGDALVGADLDALEAVAEASVTYYEMLNAPIYYVMGNHETDYHRHTGKNRYPLYELIRNRPGWHTMARLSDFYFVRDILGYRVFFLGDHAAEDSSWFSTVGTVVGDTPKYPHTAGQFVALRRQIASSPLPVLIASHYAFQGGQRPSDAQDPLLPLPANVQAHFHGHAHIGDLVWNKENPWQRIHPIQSSNARQYNVSALETGRTPGSHSALLTINDDGSLFVQFRCHIEKAWIESKHIAPLNELVIGE